ncbi:MAG: hypothetical protein KAR19_05225 [Bacteroidales bacterium]|nr:hypothetical protein [Bacteroidales bacterium]
MKKNAIALIVLLGVTLSILFLVFGKVIIHPNQFVFSSSGDAIKSYYNFCYYLKYDSGIGHDGINYPYGDHLQYINSHPLYLQIIKFIDRFIYPVSDYGVGILNLTMIFSLLVAIPFIYLILRKFSLPPWYSAVITLIILFLSPQLDRLGGHFEMVYAFFIPLYWYLLIRWNEGKNRLLWTILLLLTALVGGFTSAYYVAFLAIFPMAILLVELWNRRKNLSGYMKEGLLLLVIAILPLIIVKGLVTVTDWVDDRPDNPWGFFIFHSNIFSIFLPPRSILKELTSGLINMNFRWEGRAYVGFPATLLALAFAYTMIHQLVTRKKPGLKFFFPNRKLNTYLSASVIILIFAMCIPFNWGMEFLLKLLPPLKQFRCLGRFSWIFYYVFTVYTATFFYTFFRRARKKGFRITSLVFLIFMLSYWSLEAASNLRKSTRRIFNQNEILANSGEETLAIFEEAGVDPDDFQGIFFLPFANTCGDKLLFDRGMEAFSEAMRCSHHTGIPIIESFSPRISFSQGISSIQLLADSAIYKQRVDDMTQEPVLLVVTHEKLTKQESALLGRAQLLWTGDKVSFASLPVKAFNAGHASWSSLAGNISDSLACEGPLCSDAPLEKVFYEGFNSYSSDQVFTGSGARYKKKGKIELINEVLYQKYSEERVEISFWLFVDTRIDNMPTAEIWRWDENNTLIDKEKLNTRAEHNVDSMWVRVDKTFKPEPGVRYQLTLRGKYITVDDLLLKPEGARVMVSQEEGPGLFDNFKVPVAPEE